MNFSLVSLCLALTLSYCSVSTRVLAKNSCNIRKIQENRLVCVCNSESCDELLFQWPQKSGEARVVETSEAGKRFEVTDLNIDERLSNKSEKNVERILVNLTSEYQEILGWGGAITDATAINVGNLSQSLRDQIIESYYGDGGLQYNFIRVPLGGSDFSTRPYSYADTDTPDYELKSWALADEDINHKIPTIKKAIEIAKHRNVSLKIFASSWSPPKWMKTSNSLVRGYLIDKDQVYESYTNYLMKFFEAYEKEGITFWGATVQNEPFSSYLPFYSFNSLQMNAQQVIKLISKFLGPALVARGKTKENFKLMVGDDNLGFLNYYVPDILNDKGVQKYVSGLAFHWYTSGIVVPYKALSNLYNSVKDKIEFMLMTEACTGSSPLDRGVSLGNWDRGQAYASDIIEDLLRNSVGWIDWNLALNMQGGPNWANNFVDSPIIVGENNSEYYKQPMYYALAHFSRFFKPGSIRVESKIEAGAVLRRSVSSVAMHNKETGHLIINILNTSKEQRKIEVVFNSEQDSISDQKLIKLVVDARSISSVVIKL